MYPSRYWLCTILAVSILLSGCAAQSPSTTSVPVTQPPKDTASPIVTSSPETTNQAAMPNPATVYCEQQGGQVEIRADSEGNQYGICIFEDGSECDEWAFYRGECKPGQPQAAPSEVHTPAYINEAYGFSFDLPSSWAIEEYIDYLLFTRPGYKMFVGYQWADEDPRPFRTGMPEGDFIDGGTTALLGQAIPKRILVFEGKNKVVAYGGRIKIGDIILVIYLDAVETDAVSYRELDIPPEIIAEADQIIASFALVSEDTPMLEFNP